MWVQAVPACRPSVEVLRRCLCGGGGRRKPGKGVAHQLTEQARIDNCTDYGGVFLREPGVCEEAHVVKCQVGGGRGEKGSSEFRT